MIRASAILLFVVLATGCHGATINGLDWTKLTSEAVSKALSSGLSVINEQLKDTGLDPIEIPEVKKTFSVSLIFTKLIFKVRALGEMYGLATFKPNDVCSINKVGTGYHVECGFEYGPVNGNFKLEAQLASESKKHGFSADLKIGRCSVGINFDVSSTGKVTVNKLGLLRTSATDFKTSGDIASVFSRLLSPVKDYLSEHVTKFMDGKLDGLKSVFEAMVQGQITSLLS